MFKELKMTAMAVGVLALGGAVMSAPAFAVVAGAVVVENEDSGVSALQAQITAALSDTNLSSEQLATKIESIVSGAADPAAAAQLVISSASGSSSAVQTAVGNGLGKAANDVGVNNPTAGAAISTAVTSSGTQSMQTAYTNTSGSTGSTNGQSNQTGGNPVAKKTTQQTSDTTGSPN